MPTLEDFEARRAQHFDDKIAKLREKIKKVEEFYEGKKVSNWEAKIKEIEKEIERQEQMKMAGKEERLRGTTPSFWNRFFGGKSRKRRRTGRRKLHKRTRK